MGLPFILVFLLGVPLVPGVSIRQLPYPLKVLLTVDVKKVHAVEMDLLQMREMRECVGLDEFERIEVQVQHTQFLQRCKGAVLQLVEPIETQVELVQLIARLPMLADEIVNEIVGQREIS